MKYGLGIRLLLSFLVGGVAVLYKVKVNPKMNLSEVSSSIKVPRPFIFDMVTNPVHVPTYFSWVTRLREVDKTKKITIGKEYVGIVNMPFLGQYNIRYVISEFKDDHWVILKPRAVTGSFFNTEVVLMVSSISNEETHFQMKILYQRTSALFQMTLGPILKWLTDAQLAKVAARVRALSMAKWAQSPASYKIRIKNRINSTVPNSPRRPVMKFTPQIGTPGAKDPAVLYKKQKI